MEIIVSKTVLRIYYKLFFKYLAEKIQQNIQHKTLEQD